MTSEPTKKIYFVAGLPRSGSTLLVNILGQNPRFGVTPTSGILDMLVQIRNIWDQNHAFRAMARADSERRKHAVLCAMLDAYFADFEKPICFDKSRAWLEFLEMAAAILGRENLRVLVTVRDLRDVVASFELRHRETSSLSRIPQEASEPMRFKTAPGRIKTFIANDQPVGRACNAIRDAITRGWQENICFVEYESLTADPVRTIGEIYRFLGEDSYQHDFNGVEQITEEDDFVHGFRDLHLIRPKVAKQAPRWPKVYSREVMEHEIWAEVERNAKFWRAYL